MLEPELVYLRRIVDDLRQTQMRCVIDYIGLLHRNPLDALRNSMLQQFSFKKVLFSQTCPIQLRRLGACDVTSLTLICTIWGEKNAREKCKSFWWNREGFCTLEKQLFILYFLLVNPRGCCWYKRLSVIFSARLCSLGKV